MEQEEEELLLLLLPSKKKLPRKSIDFRQPTCKTKNPNRGTVWGHHITNPNFMHQILHLLTQNGSPFLKTINPSLVQFHHHEPPTPRLARLPHFCSDCALMALKITDFLEKKIDGFQWDIPGKQKPETWSKGC